MHSGVSNGGKLAGEAMWWLILFDLPSHATWTGGFLGRWVWGNYIADLQLAKQPRVRSEGHLSLCHCC